jgi:hypothetical protein
MEEQIISFETAKLAKECNYKEKCKNWYNFSGLLIKDAPEANYPSNQKKFPSYSAPTQSLLQRWLREVHNIHIEIVYIDEVLKFQAQICLMGTNTIISDTKCGTYEEVLEEGLKEALNLINKKV